MKALARNPFVQETLGAALAGYLRLVRRTNAWISEPADIDAAVAGKTPVIVAMWHGQHLMISYARPKSIVSMGALISRSADGDMQAAALRRLGVRAIRGSGGGGKRSADKGGAVALLEMARLLQGGMSIAMTADAPKRARICAPGIAMLAKVTGRPIAPTAVVTSKRFDFDTWDRASLGKPYGVGAIVIGDLIEVAGDADEAMLAAARARVEAGLDAAHARAYALVGGQDPGRALRDP